MREVQVDFEIILIRDIWGGIVLCQACNKFQIFGGIFFKKAVNFMDMVLW